MVKQSPLFAEKTKPVIAKSSKGTYGAARDIRTQGSMKTAQDSGRNSVFAKHAQPGSPTKKQMDQELQSIEDFEQLLQGSKFDTKKPGTSLSQNKTFYKPG